MRASATMISLLILNGPTKHDAIINARSSTAITVASHAGVCTLQNLFRRLLHHESTFANPSPVLRHEAARGLHETSLSTYEMLCGRIFSSLPPHHICR
jgi:hypothetical protein